MTALTKEQLIKHITRQIDQFHRLIKAQPLGDNSYNQKTIAALEIALSALTAEPVMYISNGSLFTDLRAAEVCSKCYGTPITPLFSSVEIKY